MIGFLTGSIAEITEDSVVLDVQGVGFEVLVSAETASALASMGMGAECKLYTYTYVREDALLLYGFLNREELSLYKKLITVSGIGPKGALSLLSGMSADDLRFAIVTGDVKTISKAPGIGKKTAERLILDLRDKLGSAEISSGADWQPAEVAGGTGEGGAVADATEALVSLGYPRMNAMKAVRAAKEELTETEGEDTELLLKNALRFLG